MEVTTNIKGQIATSKTELRALELGYIPSKPIFDARYDMILDDRKGKLTKVQIRYGDGKLSHSTGSVMVKLAYQTRKKALFTYGQNEIDALIAYLPKIDCLCFFRQKFLRENKSFRLDIHPLKTVKRLNFY